MIASRARRFIGSKDRSDIAERLYRLLRSFDPMKRRARK